MLVRVRTLRTTIFNRSIDPRLASVKDTERALRRRRFQVSWAHFQGTQHGLSIIWICSNYRLEIHPFVTCYNFDQKSRLKFLSFPLPKPSLSLSPCFTPCSKPDIVWRTGKRHDNVARARAHRPPWPGLAWPAVQSVGRSRNCRALASPIEGPTNSYVRERDRGGEELYTAHVAQSGITGSECRRFLL